MCYMRRREQRVGVRELRQNLSVYLRRVTAGETLQVTERGKPVALFTPLPEASTALRRLVSSGRSSVPTGDLLALGLPQKSSSRKPLREALKKVRDERL